MWLNLTCGLALLLYLSNCIPQAKHIEKRATENLSSVSATVPLPVNRVERAIEGLFESKQYFSNEKYNKFENFQVEKAGSSIFNRILPNNPVESHPKNIALQKYFSMDTSLRKHDFYLWNVSDFYWYSEYYCNNAPAKFKCDFIINLQSEENANTRIEIFEYNPSVWVGKQFTVGHHGADFYSDIRSVEPTTTDRVDLLNMILQGTNENK